MLERESELLYEALSYQYLATHEEVPQCYDPLKRWPSCIEEREREREKERERESIYIYRLRERVCESIYIYIQRERERV
jgi:hypothetical protein